MDELNSPQRSLALLHLLAVEWTMKRLAAVVVSVAAVRLRVV
jgi:hypothetical protein